MRCQDPHGPKFLNFCPALLLMVLAFTLPLNACDSDGDVNALHSMRLTADMLPASPTNAHADDAGAALLGQRLFFDKRLSVDGTIACASCHSPDHGFSDPRPFSVGVRGQTGGRHAMPIATVAFQAFTLWDGRGDSVWIQPLKAIENPKEMDLTRLELARVVATNYSDEYQKVFGTLPVLKDAPTRAKPGMAEWDALAQPVRNDVDRVAANVGKAIEAYERKILCSDTRFDRWAAGEVTLSHREMNGAQAFAAHRCTHCHSGPTFSDGQFHNVGVPSSDRGRAVGIGLLLADPFNGAGAFSDDPTAGQAKLALLSQETGTEGAFRTPSLRGAGQRTFFGHAAHKETLRGFIDDVYHGRDERRSATVGSLDPKLQRVNVPDDELDDLVAFLHTLDCPSAPALSVAP